MRGAACYAADKCFFIKLCQNPTWLATVINVIFDDEVIRGDRKEPPLIPPGHRRSRGLKSIFMLC